MLEWFRPGADHPGQPGVMSAETEFRQGEKWLGNQSRQWGKIQEDKIQLETSFNIFEHIIVRSELVLDRLLYLSLTLSNCLS